MILNASNKLDVSQKKKLMGKKWGCIPEVGWEGISEQKNIDFLSYFSSSQSCPVTVREHSS